MSGLFGVHSFGTIRNKRNFNFQKNAHSFWKRNTHGGGDLRTTTSSNRKPVDPCGRPRWISRQKFPKRTLILCIPSEAYSVHSVHSAIGSRMNGMIFRSLRKRNSSQKNTNTVYSENSYSGIVPKERTLKLKGQYGQFLAMEKIQKTQMYRLEV